MKLFVCSKDKKDDIYKGEIRIGDKILTVHCSFIDERIVGGLIDRKESKKELTEYTQGINDFLKNAPF